jgi:hypothetical protein
LSEGLSKHLHTFLKAFPSLEIDALTSLLLKPLLYEHACEFNYLKCFVPNLFVGLYCNIKCLSTGKVLAPIIIGLGMN